MMKYNKRIISALVCLSLLLSMLTLSVLADTTVADGSETTDAGTGADIQPPELESLAFDKEIYNLKIGDKVQTNLTITPDGAEVSTDDLNYDSMKKSVATISSTGVITAVGIGEANIVIVYRNQIVSTATVSVTSNKEYSYKISTVSSTRENLITGFTVGARVVDEELNLADFLGDTSAQLYDVNGKRPNGSSVIATGMYIEADGVRYTVVIKGDVDGDGSITFDDTKRLVKCLSGEYNYPNAAFIEAATVNGSYADGVQPTIECSLMISRHVLDIEKIAQ